MKGDIITIVFPGAADAAGFVHFQSDRFCRHKAAWRASGKTFFIRDTGSNTSPVELAGAAGTIGTGLADITFKTESAVVEKLSKRTGLFKNQMVPDPF